MPRKYKHDEEVNRYTIKRDDFHNSGAMALSYAAEDSSGRKVFFKQYKSPTIRVNWYRDYVAYQKELKRRIDGSSVLKQFCYEMLDFFEYKKNYHQVFEWVESSEDLAQILEKVKAGRGPDFDQRVILAKRLMGSIAQLHAENIVHADLKPENLQLKKDPTISAGHKLVLIDMDFSVLSDRKAPWHDDPETGYVGSPNFYSPEHLRGEAPVAASDVFTCALILHELLGVGHPYDSEDPDEYKDKALHYRAPEPRLEGQVKDDATTELVAVYLHHCLNPDPSKRPTAKALRDALNGKAEPLPPVDPKLLSTRPEPPVTPQPPVTPPEPRRKKRPKPPPARMSTLRLAGSDGQSIEIKIKTTVGKSIVNQFGEDAQFWSEPQFSLEKVGDGWMVTHDSNAKNETMLNGKAVTGSQPVADGDQLAVGREAKGIVKLPLQVKIS